MIAPSIAAHLGGTMSWKALVAAIAVAFGVSAFAPALAESAAAAAPHHSRVVQVAKHKKHHHKKKHHKRHHHHRHHSGAGGISVAIGSA